MLDGQHAAKEYRQRAHVLNTSVHVHLLESKFLQVHRDIHPPDGDGHSFVHLLEISATLKS